MQPIPSHWLVHKLEPSDDEFSAAMEELRPLMQEGDELWFYDEPAPPGVNAGELGIALARGGKPIHAIIAGIH